MIHQFGSRRAFIHKYVRAGVFFLSGGMALSSCHREKKGQGSKAIASSDDACNDLSDVSAEEIQKRESLGYVKESPIVDNQCSNCNLYLPSGADKNCGGCMLFKGPVNAEGYCTYWAPKV